MGTNVRGKRLFVTIIEWNCGVSETTIKPPTTYYNWRKKLVGRIRDAYSTNRLHENLGDDSVVLVQESVIMSASQSMAHAVRDMVRKFAQDDGISINVFSGEFVADNVDMTQVDLESFVRLLNVFGRRGRPPTPQKWFVTDLETLLPFSDVEDSEVAMAPNGSLHFNAIAGDRPMFAQPKDVLELMRARFARGKFTNCLWNDQSPEGPPIDVVTASGPEANEIAAIWAVIKGVDSGRLPSDFSPDKIVETINCLDAVVVSRAYHDHDYLRKRRIEAITQYLLLGGNGTNKVTHMDIDPAVADWFDTAAVISPEVVGRNVKHGVW